MVPLIFIGVVFGLLVMGKMFDFFALLGVLGLVGMNIKNAIVLVDQIGIEQENGLAPLDACCRPRNQESFRWQWPRYDDIGYAAPVVRRHVWRYGCLYHGWLVGSQFVDHRGVARDDCLIFRIKAE